MKIAAATLLLLMSLLPGPSPLRAAEPDTPVIQWYLSHFPPSVIRSGASQGQGTGDRRIAMVVRRTPEFRHEIVDASGTRLMLDIKTKPNVCSPNLLKTPEREAFIEYSVPMSWILPNGIITTRSRLAKFKPYLNEHGELRLADFLAAPGNRVAVVGPRSFGAGIDQVLKQQAGRASIVEVSSVNYSASTLMKLATQDEYDALLGYAVELRYLAPQLGLDEKDFVFFTAAEQRDLIYTYMGCSKSELGKRFIATINRMYEDKRTQQEDADVYRSWLSDDMVKLYDRLLARQAASKAAGSR